MVFRTAGLRCIIAAAALAVAGILTLPATIELTSYILPRPRLDRFHMISPTVLDGNGQLLRAFLAEDGRWRLLTTSSDITETHRNILLAYEDKRFYRHNGIDYKALARAAWQLVSRGKAVSGASTITMQVARLLEPRPPGLRSKFLQMVGARQLERRFTKDKILTLYLTLLPFGGNMESVRAAALSYFRKEPRNLSTADIALLVSLPQAPELRRPDRFPDALSASRVHALERMASIGVISQKAAASARNLPVPKRGNLAFAAPHFAEWLLPHASATRRPVETYISPTLQKLCERLAFSAVKDASPGLNAAILAVRNSDRAILAYVGGADYASRERAGELDLIQTKRSPGSTLKPLIYGIAFEDRLLHPDTTVTDGPKRFGTYEPENFSSGYSGDVSVRTALIRSFNTVAVAVLAELGPQRLLSRLRAAGVPMKLPQSDSEAGLAIALGGGGFSLYDLVTLYTGLANKGHVKKLIAWTQIPVDEGYDILPSDANWAVVDILADMPPPAGAGALASKDGRRRVAYKTGTSFGFRDAWAIGFDQNYTVGVWVGRPDGAPNPEAFGITVAAPILFRVFDGLPQSDRDVAGWLSGSSIFATQEIPERLERFEPSVSKGTSPLKILFPAENTTVQVDERSGVLVPLPLSVSGGIPPYQWFSGGSVISAPTFERVKLWSPPGQGATSLQVFDSAGKQAKTEFWVEVRKSQ